MEYELKEVEWYVLGVHLEITPHVLRSIERDNPTKERKLSEALQYCLKTGKALSWERIVNALRRIGGYARIVEAIESKYIPGKINVQNLYCPVHCLTTHDGQAAQYSPTGADYSYLASYVSIIAWYREQKF